LEGNLALIWPLFGLYLAFIWPFVIFQDLAFFETAYGQIWPSKFFWTWQPCVLHRQGI